MYLGTSCGQLIALIMNGNDDGDRRRIEGIGAAPSGRHIVCNGLNHRMFEPQ
jgi:hypothetical protein